MPWACCPCITRVHSTHEKLERAGTLYAEIQEIMWELDRKADQPHTCAQSRCAAWHAAYCPWFSNNVRGTQTPANFTCIGASCASSNVHICVHILQKGECRATSHPCCCTQTLHNTVLTVARYFSSRPGLWSPFLCHMRSNARFEVPYPAVCYSSDDLL